MDEATKPIEENATTPEWHAGEPALVARLKETGHALYSCAFTGAEVDDLSYRIGMLDRAYGAVVDALCDLLLDGRAYKVTLRKPVWIFGGIRGDYKQVRDLFFRRMARVEVFETLRFQIRLQAVLADYMQAEVGECADLSGFGPIEGVRLRVPPDAYGSQTREFESRSGRRLS